MKTHLLLATLALAAAATASPAAAQTISPTADREAVGYMFSRHTGPVVVTARDLLTKVFGVSDHRLSRHELASDVKSNLNMELTPDEGGLWLDPTDGYAVSYYGMIPQTSAVAMFSGENPDEISNFCFFFLFPYNTYGREVANLKQCAFCASLLQEMDDIGVDMGCPETTDAMFEASGSYGENMVNLRLINVEEGSESDLDRSLRVASTPASAPGRFIIILNVEPRAFTQSDTWVAAQ